jgi:hypothetical protein
MQYGLVEKSDFGVREINILLYKHGYTDGDIYMD